MVTLNNDWISDDRLKPYLDCVFNDTNKALRLYELDRQLSAALFLEISYLEVALRNSINAFLTDEYGPDWYADLRVGFDERVRDNIAEAWESLPSHYTTKGTVRGSRLGGRLVAASMFRTWTNMLDKGGASGLPAPFERADHDRIWTSRALLKVFPGAKTVSRAKDPSFENRGLNREWVYSRVFLVRQIRNRIAHHESLAPNGVPITGTELRLTPRQCHEACQDLAEMLDRELANYLRGFSTLDPIDEIETLLKADT